jgi:hypothetical protein
VGRFDRETGDPFAPQNEITSRIAVALDTELVGAEAARPTERPDALDYVLRGRAASWKSPTPDKCAEAIGFFERALSLSPDSVEAMSLLAAALANRVLDHMSHMPAEDLANPEALVAKALSGSPRFDPGPFRQSRGAAGATSARRGDTRVPDGNRIQSQLG